jgi:hypothetical protein
MGKARTSRDRDAHIGKELFWITEFHAVMLGIVTATNLAL